MPEKDEIVGWIKTNAWNLILTLAIAASAYGALKVENSWRDEKITAQKADIDSHGLRVGISEKLLAEIKFRQDINTIRIEGLTTDQKVSQRDISDIKAQLGVLSNKFDNTNDKIDKLTLLIKEKVK